ncbi:MAG: beta strand repeat-containing protein, partial [Caulobacteraceae bacterium]
GYGAQNGGVGGVGGAGLILSQYGAISSYKGSIVGGLGGRGGAGQAGGAGGEGGAAIAASAAANLRNNALIVGGAGGVGGAASARLSYGGTGGDGGEGFMLGAGGTILNAATIAGGGPISIIGGAGGTGGQGGLDAGGHYQIYGGAGGVGGAGIALSGAGTITNRSLVEGGSGGAGGQGGSPSAAAAAGGLGGAGVDISTSAAVLSNLGVNQGGQGGAASAAPAGSGHNEAAGAGGAGGSGINLAAGDTGASNGYVYGGQGGTGGSGSGYAAGGKGGVGGDGIDLKAGATIVNRGVIGAGAGGAGGSSQNGPNGAAGARGNGVVLAASCGLTNAAYAAISGRIGVYAAANATTVINYGTISGDVNSVKLGSASDVLVVETNAQFVGRIAGGGGTLDFDRGTGTITGLGGVGVASGSVSATFAGFGSYVFGANGWTLGGTNSLAAGQSLDDDGAVTVGGSLNEAAGAIIMANTGASLTFTGGGDSFSGTVEGVGTVSLVGVTDTINAAHLTVAAIALRTATVTLTGSILETGVLSLASSTVRIAAAGATLSGGGQVTLNDNPSNSIVGVSPAAAFTNVDTTISGSGSLGGGQMSLTNRLAGAIVGSGAHMLIIDTGANQIVNAGLIEATGPGGVTVQSAVQNTGVLEAAGSFLTVNGAVSGQGGQAIITGGGLVFNAAFQQNVSFTNASGSLQLADSQHYTGSISGFSKTGATSLDLRDIGFVNSGEATFSGTASQGVLTVTDGTHAANITLIGNYTAANFVAVSDGHGGVTIVDPTSQDASTQRFVDAMAGLGGQTGGAASILADASRSPPHNLVAPRVHLA